MKKMNKRTYKFIVTIMLSCILLSFNVVDAVANDLNKNITDTSLTMEKLQNMVLEYFESNNIPYQVGTLEYLDYITNQLLFGTDQEIKKLDNYDMITAYFAHYKNIFEDAVITNSLGLDAQTNLSTTDITSFAAESVETNDFLNTTIEMLQNEFTDSAEINDDLFISNNQLTQANAIITSYSPSAATNYAKKWAGNENSSSSDYHKSNPNYIYFSDGDCTNFGSQCLYAGKVPMSGKPASPYPGINSSTTKWYYAEFNQLTSCDELTTSWCRVVDFNKYFTNKAYKYTYKTRSSLVSKCELGDVIQLAHKTTGEPYHTIIITYKSANSVLYCGHTSHRNNASITTINESTNNFILFDFTH